MCLFVLFYLFIGTDPEDVIRNAFACFDEEGTGYIHEDRYRVNDYILSQSVKNVDGSSRFTIIHVYIKSCIFLQFLKHENETT